MDILRSVQQGLRRMGLVLWKNLLLRKRQWVVMIFEIILPQIISIIIMIQLTTFGVKSPKLPPVPAQTFQMFYPKDLKWDDCDYKNRETGQYLGKILAYAPSNSVTDAIIKGLSNHLCRSSGPILVGLDNEAQLEQEYKNKWQDKREFGAAVVFNDPLVQGNQISTKIRMHAKCLLTTGDLYPPQRGTGFNTVGPNQHIIQLYADTGWPYRHHECENFLGLQWYLDQLLIEKFKGPESTGFVGVSFQPLPYPEYTPLPEADPNTETKLMVVCYMLALGGVFMTASVTRNVLAERGSGISELLRLTGVPLWMQWLGWYVHIIEPQLPFILLMVLMMTLVPGTNGLAMLERSDTFLVFLIFLLFLLAKVSMGFLFCAIFRQPILTTSMAVMVSFTCILFCAVIFFVANSLTKQILAVFLPDFAFVFTLFTAPALELRVVDNSDGPLGITWSSLKEPVLAYWYSKEKEPPVGSYLLCLCGHFVVYLLVAAYMEGVFPSEHGIRRPCHFFTCSKGYRRINRVAPPPGTPVIANSSAVAMEEGQSQEVSASKSQPSEVGVEHEVANKKGAMTQPASRDSVIPPSSFEAEPVGATVGLEAIDMYKRFGSKAVVNGVTLKLFSGDIFALLGHNGAGKTTLISMLTGFFEPSEGTAFVDGYDIRTDLEKARGRMGLCPQHNMLFEKLTTMEQLRLFGMLRGLNCEGAKAEAQTLLVKMSLTDKANVVASKLSGGQKRKLSLAIALIGGTRVIVLDEPTSGMDPQARREIWDLLLQLRGERTILLTTHFMEEADVLGDRIGIMAAGQLQCVGSAAFLKKYYGTGYTLKLTLMGGPVASAGKISPSTQQTAAEGESSVPSQQLFTVEPSPAATAILAAVQKFVPNASFKEDSRVNANEVFINLPSETTTTQVLNQMFAALTSQKAKLSINTIGLSQTTMDEVFVRVGELAHPVDKAAHSALDEADVFQKSPKETKNRVVVQFLSLLQKKLLYMMHRWISLLFAILLLLFMFLAAVHVSIHVLLPVHDLTSYGAEYQGRSRGANKNFKTHRNLPLNLKPYKDKNPITLCSGDELLKDVIGPSAKAVSNITQTLFDVYGEGREGRIAYKKQYVVAIERTDQDVRAFYNLHPYHAAPVAVNLASNYLLRLTGSQARIETSNHPFEGEAMWLEPSGASPGGRPPGRSTQNNATARNFGSSEMHGCFKQRSVENRNKAWVPKMFGALIPVGLVIFLAYFVSQPVEEKLSQLKQLQTMTGVSPLVYWGATFLFDFALYTLVVLGLLIWLVIIDVGVAEFNMFTANGGWFVFLALCLAYGVTAIPLCYLLSLRSNSVVGGYSLVLIFQLLGVFPFAYFIPDGTSRIVSDGLRYFLIILHWLNRLNPSYAMARGFWYYADVSVKNSECPLKAVNPSACPPKARHYWVWSTRWVGREEAVGCSGEEIDIPDHNDIYNVPGIGQELFFVIIWSFIYCAWLLVVEFKLCRKLMRSSGKPNLGDFPPNINDQDVWDEGERVNELLTSGQVDSEALIVHQLSKSFGGFAAVNNLDFGVHFGECFGLLGVNGAGKTTG